MSPKSSDRIECVAAMVLALVLAVPAASSAEEGAAKKEAASQQKPNGRPRVPPAPAGPFEESTSVEGKIESDLQGVWLLVTTAQIAPGKYKTFPELLKITNGKQGPEFHLLDVRMPEDVQASITKANRTLSSWTPSEKTRKALGQKWAELPKAKEKSIQEFLYGRIEYSVVAPDKFDQVFVKRNPVLDNVLKGSLFGIKVVEDYKPRHNIPPGASVSQLIERQTVYGVKSAQDGIVKGDHILGFVAAGMGTPIPMQFAGPFTMYRLASLS
jgi:hypothetical protein